MIKTIAWLTALAVTFLPSGFQQPKSTSQTSSLANKEAAPPKWIEFVSKEGAFSTLLPSQPEKQDQSSDSPLGRIDIHMFMAINEGGVYLVGYSDVPALATEDKSPVLDEMRKLKSRTRKPESATSVSSESMSNKSNPVSSNPHESFRSPFTDEIYDDT